MSTKDSSKKWSKKPQWVKKKDFKKKKSQIIVNKDKRANAVHVQRGPRPDKIFAKMKITGDCIVSLSNGAYNESDFISYFNNLGGPSNFFAYQPTYFDQWSQMYQRYTVLACAIKCWIKSGLVTNSTTNPGNLVTCTIVPTTMTKAQFVVACDHNSTTGAGRQMDVLNDPRAKTVMIGSPYGGHDETMISHYVKLKDLYPDKDVETDPDFTGTTTSFTSGLAAPVNLPIWGVLLQSDKAAATSVNDITVTIRAQVTFYTIFSSPAQLYDT